MNIKPNQFDSIIKKGYSLDHVYLLELIRDEIDIRELLKHSVKISTLYSTLLRKNLIISNTLTLEGKNLLEFIESDDAIRFTKLKISINNFDAFWSIYPGTDTFEYKEKLFKGSRALRMNKSVCLEKFNKIILEGEYTAHQINKALEFDVTQKKEQSYKSGTNKLTYMQNSLTYLNQRSFEAYIDLINSGIKPEEEFTSTNSFDI